MAAVEKVSVALSAQLAAEMRKAVAAGEYASTSEVMQEAVLAWARDRAERRQAAQEVGLAWDRGMVSAPVDGEEAFARIRARLDARLRETGA